MGSSVGRAVVIVAATISFTKPPARFGIQRDHVPL